MNINNENESGQSVPAAAPGDQWTDKQQREDVQVSRFTDALVVRIGEEDEASYECCRTY